MSIADEIRVKQNYGPEGYKFEVLAGELKWEPFSGSEVILVKFHDVPLTAFGDRIPNVAACTDGSPFNCPVVNTDEISNHYEAAKDKYSYRCTFTVFVPWDEGGKTISFSFDSKMIHTGGRAAQEYKWPLVSRMFNLNCKDLVV